MPRHISGKSYNERLFAGGLRSHFHYARFKWVRSELLRLGIRFRTVLELGCFDGRLLGYLPYLPDRYVGVDANWEGGLDTAIEKYASVPGYAFLAIEHPDDIDLGVEQFDLACSLETLEHIPPELVDGFLAQIAKHLHGYLLVSVPNEVGPVFLLKWSVKHIFRMSPTEYTASELFNTFIGRSDRVRRKEHKGFNYRHLVNHIGKHFHVVRVVGFPFSFLPTWLCFGVGITATSRNEP